MSISSVERRRKITLARLMWGGFYRCPTTNKIVEALEGDDKVLCYCGRSNPRCAQERTEVTGVHVVRYLTPATAEEYVDEHEL